MAPVVADTTCLIALDRIGRLALLPALFPEILIPPEVELELGRSLPWLTVRHVSDHLLVTSLGLQVDRGRG